MTNAAALAVVAQQEAVVAVVADATDATDP
jgi:hypothetical protein